MIFNVLVVDDDELLRDMFKEALEVRGHKILLASDGVEGVLAVVQDAGQEIDFVLMDVMMPNLNGLNALRIMRHVNPCLPVIIFTGYSSDHDYCRKAIGYGALCCFSKPFSMNDVISRMVSFRAHPSTGKDSSL